ncbi:helix-turn-helix domain-containing protein [Chryseobacterium koreense]|uniref:helix-turn-helix domain-containing protein n=1 Tax=Chryseobacterium koreense TaxID=232216 RepID=UPI0026F0AE56|nr:helix-turn-helix transcriptional regulator [Chryseobacterium koreense]
MDKVIEYATTQFDFDLTNHIKILRKSKSLNKEDLSIRMGLAKSFVGNVESYTQRHKYSTRHITLLAKALGIKNISKLMNFPTPEYDRIKVTVKQTMNENNTKVISSEVIKIEPIE